MSDLDCKEKNLRTGAALAPGPCTPPWSLQNPRGGPEPRIGPFLIGGLLTVSGCPPPRLFFEGFRSRARPLKGSADIILIISWIPMYDPTI